MMRGFRIVVLVLSMGVVLSFVFVRTNTAQTGSLQELQDRADIQSLIVRYGTALDTLDADGYAAVFTEDAELDVAGNVRKGRQQIRAIVTGLQESRATNKANGTPTSALVHVISNTSIEIVTGTEARHHSYWQTVRVGANNQITVGAIGRYDDELIKRNGRWLIRSRKIMPFTN
jgi:uncharacterized protein (TIGR02246 family)